MALSVNWATKVVTVPKADTTFVSTDPVSGREIREFDLSAFRLELKAIEASEEGIPFVDIHRHNTTVTISGVTLARVIEIINGYQIEFEDGQYAVNLVGANSNVADVAVVNQVSIRANNSAGLIEVTSGSGLSPEQATYLLELWRIAGLDILNPMTVTKTNRSAGPDIDLDITYPAADTVTVERQP